jgi:citrate synthase/citryl-CoA lyase
MSEASTSSAKGAPPVAWKTAIAKATDDGVVVRGYDVIKELTGTIDFGQMIHLLFKGELCSPETSRMINALFVCVADHGISPSSTVTRFIQASGVPIQCAVAAGIMTIGDIHGGAGEAFTRSLQELVATSQASGRAFADVAREFVAQHKRVEGFGHPQHPKGDPRTQRLFALAEEYGLAGSHIAMTRCLEKALHERVGRAIPANLDAAFGAIISDMGFDWRFARAFISIPRSAGLFAHAVEEQVRESGWRQIPLDQIHYDGVVRTAS